MLAMSSWILSLMVLLQPPVGTPWASTYPSTADAIARGATEAPLFAGKDGPERTAALLVAVAKFESNFKPNAVGDHGRSHGIFQSSRIPVASVDEQVAQALGMMRASFKVCAGRKLEDALSWYASGGTTCTNAGGIIASRHRVGLALRLFREHPPTASMAMVD